MVRVVLVVATRLVLLASAPARTQAPPPLRLAAAGDCQRNPNYVRPGRRIVVGFQEFAENETLAYMYAEALRGAGFRVTVRSAGGLRPQTVSALRHGRIGMYPGYSGSLLGYLGGTSLKRALARIGAQPLTLSSAQDRNGFAMKADVARKLGISKLSDLARYWPATSHGRATPRAIEDPLQGEQWAVAPGALLDLPGAWALSQGAGVTVAVVDSGTLLDHPDPAPTIWTDFGEIPGNGIDDDHNGFVDDVHGVDLTSLVPDQNIGDANGHGTHVAGIIAAAANGRGVVGVAPKAKIMTVRVLDAQGAGTTGGVADGIRYAAANGARIINLSLAAAAPDPRVDAAIAAANAAGALARSPALGEDQPQGAPSHRDALRATLSSVQRSSGRLSALTNRLSQAARRVRRSCGTMADVMRKALPLALICTVCTVVIVSVAVAQTSHKGWPKINGMVLMNKTDSSRPLDARPGHDPFDGQDPSYSCDAIHKRGPCQRRMEPSGTGRVVTSRSGHNELLGGHGNDTLYAGPWGDVLWGDYKPSGQPTTQVDTIVGGNGKDFIYAGHGTNNISAGGGNDIIKAHFGKGSIDCGGGNDLLLVSRRAQKGYKIQNCERISHKTLGY